MDNASLVLQAIANHAKNRPHHPALATFDTCIDYATLHADIYNLAEELTAASSERIAIMMDNSPSLAIADLGILAANGLCVPIPLFFSSTQIIHLLRDASIDTLITDMPERIVTLLKLAGIDYHRLASIPCISSSGNAQLFRLHCSNKQSLPKGCRKITYTSGSTGDPKGVCLSQDAMEKVASSLCIASAATANERHLSMLPFATLLENIGGLYTVMLSGATLIMPPLAHCGLEGSSSLNILQFVAALCRAKASSCILIPQMLQALVVAVAQGATRPNTLRYVAVGGAPVAPILLEQAAAIGIPVYEGYGLSEAASVVAVNTPSANQAGSVGKPLPHVRIKLADDGEILVAGSMFLGYLGEHTLMPEYLPTGDIGTIDDRGYIHLHGRKKHIFITAFGRNVSPEWVERELLMEAAIAQACVFGEAREHNAAVIVARDGVDDKAINTAISRANQRLPDYAHIHHWIIASAPFSIHNGQWTGTGRPRRSYIWQCYQNQLF